MSDLIPNPKAQEQLNEKLIQIINEETYQHVDVLTVLAFASGKLFAQWCSSMHVTTGIIVPDLPTMERRLQGFAQYIHKTCKETWINPEGVKGLVDKDGKLLVRKPTQFR